MRTYITGFMITKEQLSLLTSQFSEEKLGVKIQSVSKTKPWASLILYLQHTDVMGRLDEVDPNWETTVLSEGFKELKSFSGEVYEVYFVSMRMSICGVNRENVGEGNDPKAAYSDAVKRCAMLFGVGRYLYDSDIVWVPYDQTKDKFRIWTIKDYMEGLASKNQRQQKPEPLKPSGNPSPVKPMVQQKLEVKTGYVTTPKAWEPPPLTDDDIPF